MRKIKVIDRTKAKPAKKVNKGKIKSVKTEVYGILFDSKTESEYYSYLLKNRDSLKIRDIVLQPNYVLIQSFTVPCNRCRGTGKAVSEKTGNLINCSRCKGTKKIKRKPWTYTADFSIMYEDGFIEIVDVKGHPNESFRLVKKMFERTLNTELVVIKKAGKGWVRK